MVRSSMWQVGLRASSDLSLATCQGGSRPQNRSEHWKRCVDKSKRRRRRARRNWRALLTRPRARQGKWLRLTTKANTYSRLQCLCQTCHGARVEMTPRPNYKTVETLPHKVSSHGCKPTRLLMRSQTRRWRSTRKRRRPNRTAQLSKLSKTLQHHLKPSRLLRNKLSHLTRMATRARNQDHQNLASPVQHLRRRQRNLLPMSAKTVEMLLSKQLSVPRGQRNKRRPTTLKLRGTIRPTLAMRPGRSLASWSLDLPTHRNRM